LKYCDIEKFYNNQREFENIYLNYISMNNNGSLDNEISKKFINKIKTLKINCLDESYQVIIALFNNIEVIMKGVNLGRLVGLYYTFPLQSKELIKLIFPDTDHYFNTISKKKKVQNSLQKNGFYQLFYKVK